MNTTLAKVFVERGVIRQGTVLEAYQSTKGLSCTCNTIALNRYVVLSARANPDWVFFDVASSPTDRQRVRCDYVASIDGMAIERVATAHHLRMDGSVTGPTSRRKRTRKKKQPLALPGMEPVPLLLTYQP